MTPAEWEPHQAQIFAGVLTQARKCARRSQRELAALSGVSHTTIARLERNSLGSRGRIIRPTPNTLARIARGLVADLVANDESVVIDQQGADDAYRQLMTAAGYGGVNFEAPIPSILAEGTVGSTPLAVPYPEDPPLMGPHDIQEIHITIARSEDGSETVTVEVRGYDPLACGQAARQAICAAQERRRPARRSGGEQGAGSGEGIDGSAVARDPEIQHWPRDAD